MITEDYVPFETAKLLKEKGFDEYGMYFYTLKDEGCEGYKSNRTLREFAHNSDPDLKDRAVSCPTLQMALKWLREEKHYYIQIMLDSWALGDHSGFYVVIQKTDSDFEMMLADAVDNVLYETYEIAANVALIYVLEELI